MKFIQRQRRSGNGNSKRKSATLQDLRQQSSIQPSSYNRVDACPDYAFVIRGPSAHSFLLSLRTLYDSIILILSKIYTQF
jgi:hypothetical protein